MAILKDKRYILGADEVGYGSLAGPLCIGGVRAPKDWSISGLNDSKKLSDKQRRMMVPKIYDCVNKDGIDCYISYRSNTEIDQHGIAAVLRDSYREVALKLYTSESLIIIDGNLNFDEVLGGMDYETLIKADGLIPTVMAASIIAKVYRDDVMIKLSKEFPIYDLDNCKGYGSPKHIAAIKKYGYCDYHRKSYKLK